MRPAPPQQPAEAAGPRAGLFPRSTRLLAAGLALATVLVFGGALRCGFVDYDDDQYVTANPWVQRGPGPGSLVWALTTTESGNWHPLTWVSLLADSALWGTTPAGYHLVNVLLHAGSVVALFLFLRAATGRTGRAALAAALFALHPLRVESVVWVAERKDVLSMLPGLAAAAVWVRSVQTGAARLRVAAVILHGVSLLAKPTFVTLPVLLLLLDGWPLRRWSRAAAADLVREKVPFFALSAASALIAVAAQRQEGALRAVTDLGLAERLANASVAIPRYLLRLVRFDGLAAFYPPQSWAAWQIAGGLLLLAALTALALARRRTAPQIAFGWAWFLVALVPAIGIIQVGEQSLADRYTYLPSVGLAVALAWSLPERWWNSETPRPALAGAAVAVLGTLTVFTIRQTAVWRTTETLFRHAIAVTDGNYLAHNNLGVALARTGDLEGAIAQYEEALRISPRYAVGMNSLALALGRQGRLDEAIATFRRALEIQPWAAGQSGLGVALVRRGQTDEAIEHLAKAASMDPDNPSYRIDLAFALGKAGRWDRAATEYETALFIAPDSKPARAGLEEARARLAPAGEEVASLARSVEEQPALAPLRNTYAIALARAGRTEEAVTQWQEAIRLDPSLADARYNLGLVYATAGETAKAEAEWRAVLSLDPVRVDAHYKLAAMLSSAGRFEEAIAPLEEGLRLDPGYRDGNALLGTIFERLGRIPEAQARYEEELRRHPDSRAARQNLDRLRARAAAGG